MWNQWEGWVTVRSVAACHRQLDLHHRLKALAPTESVLPGALVRTITKLDRDFAKVE
jgi:hypothetical protein